MDATKNTEYQVLKACFNFRRRLRDLCARIYLEWYISDAAQAKTLFTFMEDSHSIASKRRVMVAVCMLIPSPPESVADEQRPPLSSFAVWHKRWAPLSTYS